MLLNSRKVLLPTLALLALVIAVAPASASHIVGMKVTVTNADAGTLTADVDVTGYAVAAYPYTTMWLGDAAYAPAVSWGDGSTVPPYGYGPVTGIPIVATSTSVGGVNVDIFRGSFSHVYAGPGPWTVTAFSPVNSPSPSTTLTGTQTTISSVGFMQGQAEVVFGGGGGSLEDIPTMSELGMILFALMLAGAALLLLKR